MFGTIRKHQTWLWAIIIGAIIVSFVYYFSPNSRMNGGGGGRGSSDYGSINGERISEDQFGNASREIILRYYFSNGHFPTEESKKNGFDPERETYQWLLLTQEANKMGIRVAAPEVARVAQGMLSQLQKSGISSPDVFIHRVLEPSGLTVDDLERFVRHYLMVQELIGTIGVSGKMVTPEEAQGLYEREHQELATEVVFFSASNYLATATPPAEAISQFYSNRLAYYRVPDRVQVTYVRFGISNLMAQAEAELMKTNFNDMVEGTLQRLGTNYLHYGKTPDEAKAKVRELMIKDKAFGYARAAANAFATPLFDKTPVKAENLATLAKEQGLTVGVSAPFDRETGPQDLDVSLEFAQRAFSRTPSDPFDGPILGASGMYVIALDKKIPSEIPPLDQIRDRVVQDFKAYQALMQARIQGTTFDATLTNELAQGKSFASICLNAKLKPVSLPAFSISTQELPEVEGRISLNQLKQMAFSTPVGKATAFQPTTEGGVILYVKAKLPIDQTAMMAELPSFINRVRMNRENDAFNEWFRKEAEKGLRDVPALRQQQPPPTMAPGASQKRS